MTSRHVPKKVWNETRKQIQFEKKNWFVAVKHRLEDAQRMVEVISMVQRLHRCYRKEEETDSEDEIAFDRSSQGVVYLKRNIYGVNFKTNK